MPTLQFKGKTAVETYHYTVPHHTLAFDPASSVLEDDQTPSLDGSVIVEGDNLLALKALLPTHAGRIKCVYIDPPYNTGNEGWVYNDNLTQPQFKEWIGEVVGKEGEDACRHDKWCCMIYPRLMLLKELLSEDGVIFISIDEREIGHLLMLMDEIFIDDNKIAVFAWAGRSGKGATTETVEMTHEYVVAYAKSAKSVKFKPVETVREGGTFEDKQGKYSREQLRQWGQGDRREDRTSMYFPITGPDDEEIYPKRADGSDGRWRCSEATVLGLLDEDNLDFVMQDDGAYTVYRKIRAGTVSFSATNSLLLDQGSAATGTIQLKRIFGGVKIFPTVKPVSLVKHLVDLVCYDDKTAIVLDSFAGSGTTGQAVLELNKEDGGSRNFILVQQKHDSKDDEKKHLNLCKFVTAERLRRVIRGYSYKTKRGKIDIKGLGGEFTYARVSDSPLFGEYRDFGDTPPPYEDLAKYVFYTETSRQWDLTGTDKATGKIGTHGGTSYFLLYTPDGEANAALDLKWLGDFAASDSNARLVVYCEKFWMHRDELRRWEADVHKSVRPMIVPFQLK